MCEAVWQGKFLHKRYVHSRRNDVLRYAAVSESEGGGEPNVLFSLGPERLIALKDGLT